ncbi:N-acetylmuramoyl-L-alanine amidase [Paramagnetospirillum magnetotacticum MS-1]|uniref:N-acetylmuramoyl-L-alanine amidase n=1 Tax=Paramagnetospirillum magnetotacticum MS-1 TaxID=272627 RepID=A0A0C2YVT9_PARME|nr:ABC transporter substrate-binding protein [Paramagnetospirillum magnetotacticum]KIL99228.1 N-acetylmuramoyl-L-alanine amidase [Paramagnetospirillum magnetotacticum MS-1]
MQLFVRLRSSVLAALALVALSDPAMADNAVSGVRLGVHPDGVTRVVMDVSHTMPFRISYRDAPYRVIIETDDLTWKAKPLGAGRTGPVSAVRHERVGGVSQVIVELQEPAVVKKAFMLSPAEGLGWRFVMDIKTANASAFQAVAAPKAVQAPQMAATVQVREAPPQHAVQPPPPPAPALPAAVASPPSPAAAALDEQTARALVQSAIDDILRTFAGRKLTSEDVQAAMALLVAKYADMQLESQHILGRYWTRATPDQQKEFQDLLEKFLTKAVAGMVDEIPADQSIVVQGAERKGDSFVVSSLASVPGEAATEVKWVVMKGSAGKPVITDVSANGGAVLATLQADFTSVVRNAANRGIEALFEPLRKKVSG